MSLKRKIQQLFKAKKGNVFVDRFCKRSDKTVLGGYNNIGFHTDLTDCEMGLGSYCGKNCSFVRTKIGKFCSIGSNVEIVYNNHPTNFVTTYMFFFDALSPYSFSVDNKVPCTWGLSADGIHSVVISNDVWIGNGAKIRGGVTIGDGAVIGMGAVVTKDVPPYAIVGGVPAKVIRYRFDERTIEKLEKSKWWDLELDKIKRYSKMFTDPEKLLEVIEKEK